MRSISVIKKNIKLLLRSKGSALVVLLAPLLIVIIIGIGFTDTGETTINIGTHSPERTELTQRFIDTLNTSNNIITMPDEERCIQSIREGVVLACITFPEGFELDRTRQQEVSFYVDESRLNLVHQLISDLGRTIDIEKTEVSQELTGDILGTLTETREATTENIQSLIGVRANIASIISEAQTSRTGLSELEIGDTKVDVRPIEDGIKSLDTDFKELKDDAEKVVEEGLEYINQTGGEGEDFHETLLALEETLDSNTTSITELNNALDNVKSSINTLRAKLEETKDVQSTTLENLDSITSNLNNANQNLDNLKTRLETTQRNLAEYTGVGPESIAQPITTNIESITTDNRKITFSFPYLLMLVILFIGIMLSSTLVYMEKESKAFFRNYTTPTKKPFLLSMTYITSLLIILIQTMIILIAVYYALDVPIMNNLDTTIIIIIIGTTTFILTGMLLGHLFNTFEAITMSTIAIGSVFIFLSNLVLPLETLSQTIQNIARYNPYVITSESIRKSMIFEASKETMQTDAIIMITYIITLIITIIIIQKISTTRYFAKIHHKRNQKIIKMPEDHHLKIPGKNMTITSIPELLETIKKMTDQEYQETIKDENIYSNWLKQDLKAKMLAKRIKNKKREKTIKTLESYVRKRTYKEN